MEKIHISKAKSLAGNFKISHAILCVIFSILFIFTALDIPIIANAATEDSGAGLGQTLNLSSYSANETAGYLWVYFFAYF